MVWDQEVAGSNPVTPIHLRNDRCHPSNLSRPGHRKMPNKVVAIHVPHLFDWAACPLVMSQSNVLPDSKKPSKGRTFLNRSLSSIWLWALVVIAFWIAKDWLFLLMFLAFVVCGLLEFFRLFPEKGFRRFLPQTLFVAIGYALLLFSSIWNGGDHWASLADGLAIAALFILIAADRIRFGLDGFRMVDEIAMTIFGFVYNRYSSRVFAKNPPPPAHR